MSRKITRISAAMMALMFVLAGTTMAAARTGAWVDEVVFVMEEDQNKAVARIESGEFDIYTLGVSQADLFKKIKASPKLDYEVSFGSYNELTFNPAGPVFTGTGKLNPFAIPAIREAVNWLIDRDYLTKEVLGGLGSARYTALNTAFADYARYADVIRQVELKYGHDFEKAKQVISSEMTKLGASLSGGKWHFRGEPVTLVFLIRTEDERRVMGDYVATQLEKVGFTVDRQYKRGADATPIWNASEPSQGKWHIYTGGWISTLVNRDLSDNFSFFYTQRGMNSPLWMGYHPSPRLDEVAMKLENGDFHTMDERRALFAEALDLSMKDSVRVWLVDRVSVWPRSANTLMATDVGAGMSASWIWGLTVRKPEQVGGRVTIGNASLLVEPWNPLAGTNWVYDMMIIRGTGESATMPDPFTGLFRPQRVKKAEVTHLGGLPVTKTLDWVDLKFAEEIQVPADAWIDWDAKTQKFITISEAGKAGLTAKSKVVVHYDDNLLRDTKWHDGSSFSLADMVIKLALVFDRGKPESKLFDSSAQVSLRSFQEAFRGIRIVKENPVVIEYYTDQVFLDAEYVARDAANLMWPFYSQGPGAWHNLALGVRTEETNELAFSAAKADKQKSEWLSFVAGPSLSILSKQLDQAAAEAYIPYAATLGKYVTAKQATDRYANLKNWNQSKKHFWVGTGPLYLDQVRSVEKIAVLKRFEQFPDSAEKWAGFAQPKVAEADLTGPSRINKSKGATFNLAITFDGNPYLRKDVDYVKYMVFDSKDAMILIGEAKALKDGQWQIDLSPQETAKLPVGASRIEIVVAPNAVSIPSFDNLQFMTLP
jgi:peptide/nickel transport system substrate-binding protein